MTLASFWNGAKAPLRENKDYTARNNSAFFRRMLKGACKKAVLPILFSGMFVFPAIKAEAQREVPLPKPTAQYTITFEINIVVALGTYRAAVHKPSHLKWHRTRLTPEWENILASRQGNSGIPEWKKKHLRDYWPVSHKYSFGLFLPKISLPADYAFRVNLFDIDPYPMNERTHHGVWFELHPQAHGYLGLFDPNRGEMQPFQGVTLPAFPIIPAQHKHRPNHSGLDPTANLAGIAPAFSLDNPEADKYIDTAAVRRLMKEMPNLTQLGITGRGGQRFVGVLMKGDSGSTFEVYKYSDYRKMMGAPHKTPDANIPDIRTIPDIRMYGNK